MNCKGTKSLLSLGGAEATIPSSRGPVEHVHRLIALYHLLRGEHFCSCYPQLIPAFSTRGCFRLNVSFNVSANSPKISTQARIKYVMTVRILQRKREYKSTTRLSSSRAFSSYPESIIVLS